MFQRLKKYAGALPVGVVAGAVATSANAAIDTSAITAGLADVGTAAGVVGAAMIIMVVATKVYKWLRRAM